MHTTIALLRGINVGGKNPVPMAELRVLFEDAGHVDVATLIQSGNVVFESAAPAGPTLAAALERQIEERFGVRSPVVLLTVAELERVARDNPFLARAAEPSQLHVVFLDGTPAADSVGLLDPDRSPPDVFEVRGRAVYLHLPQGAGRSKLTIDYFERALSMRATARNWSTTTKLLELARRRSGGGRDVAV